MEWVWGLIQIQQVRLQITQCTPATAEQRQPRLIHLSAKRQPGLIEAQIHNDVLPEIEEDIHKLGHHDDSMVDPVLQPLPYDVLGQYVRECLSERNW